MSMRSITEVEVRTKRVLVRVDFNVPLDGDRVADDSRIVAALPTLALLRERGARLVIASHLGRPKGRPRDDLRLAPVAARLAELTGVEVRTVPTVVGAEAEAASRTLGDGEMLMLENTRFEPGEETNDDALARDFAALADLYCNDAFGAAHRAHASTEGVAHHLESYAGLLLSREVEALDRLLKRPGRPFLAILGGAKVSDKLGVIAALIDRVDGILLGGGMANTFLLARGVEVRSSLVERDRVSDARALIARATERGVEIGLPVDARVAMSMDDGAQVVPIEAIPVGQAIFDIGPATGALYRERIMAAGTVFWNGPVGVYERDAFATGTREVARAVAATAAVTVAGGGDSIAALNDAGLAGEIDHVSTGGGASLEYIEGRTLPGLAAIPSV
ncbi:MAG: phosphoglycerate kinase [Chloroflexota bacterium]|nr:phosphoglycerate kinase [Chloroflexota bacterium]